MSNLKVDGFKSSEILHTLGKAFEGFSEKEKTQQMKKTNGVFEMQIKNGQGKEETWTIDAKEKGIVYRGKAKTKADVTIILSDDTFADLASGKLDGQKAFMTGKLKTRGNIMMATKLDGLLNSAKTKAKL